MMSLNVSAHHLLNHSIPPLLNHKFHDYIFAAFWQITLWCHLKIWQSILCPVHTPNSWLTK